MRNLEDVATMPQKQVTAALLLAVLSCASPAPYSPEPAPPSAATNPKCQTFPTCGVDTTCPGSTSCIKLKTCPRPICASQESACALECGGSANCAVLESYPAQLACNP
jgi:hypothetical protein